MAGMNDTTALYIGGPIDGQSFEKSEPGPWKRARSSSGEALNATEALNTLATEPDGIYIHVEQFDEPARKMKHNYIHSSLIGAWTRLVVVVV